jgi:two-component system KDP operon response regulator KdpE
VNTDRFTILLVDDETQIRRRIRHAFGADVSALAGQAEGGAPRRGLRVIEAATGQQGIDLAAAELPALVILDLDLPNLTKPFSTMGFMARVRAQLGRARATPVTAGTATRAVDSFGAFTVDAHRRRVDRKGEPVHLTPTEWALLRVFLAHPGQILTHQQLFREVWGSAAGDAQREMRSSHRLPIRARWRGRMITRAHRICP